MDSYETILSGFLSTGFNSYHIVTAGFTTGVSAVLDGFTISDGKADGTGDFAHGGGIFMDGGNLTFPPLIP